MGYQVKFLSIPGKASGQVTRLYPDYRRPVHVASYWSILLVMGCLYASAIKAADAGQEIIEVARDKFYFCQIGNVPVVDDADSGISFVALALTNVCVREYDDMNRAIARYQIDNNNERRMFKVDQKSDELKIDASRRIVELYRLGSLPEHRPR